MCLRKNEGSLRMKDGLLSVDDEEKAETLNQYLPVCLRRKIGILYLQCSKAFIQGDHS